MTASPQLENGYTRIANELMEALAQSDLNGTQCRIMIAIIRESYGRQRKSVELSYTRIARLVNQARTVVGRNLKILVARHYLTHDDPGDEVSTWSIQKDYTRWVGGPEPMIIGSDQSVTTPSDQMVPRGSDQSVTTPSDQMVPRGSDQSVTKSSDQSVTTVKERKKLKETTPIPPPALALALLPDRGGGGVEIDERYDDGDQDDDRTLDPDVMVETCEIESEQTRRAELVDSLVAAGVWRSKALEAVAAGTVSSEQDIMRCKRFIASSTADAPGASLWTNWLSNGQVPPLPRETPSSVTDSQIEAARRMREESDRMQQPPAEVIGARAMAEALRAGTLQAMPAAKKVLTRAESFWRST